MVLFYVPRKKYLLVFVGVPVVVDELSVYCVVMLFVGMDMEM